MLIFMVVISTLLMLSVKCGFNDPDILFNFSKDDYNISRMLSTMSPYTVLNMKTEINHCVQRTLLNDPNTYYTPARAWLLTRHGEKNPSKKIINDISTELVKFQNTLKKLYDNKAHPNYKYLDSNVKKIIRNISKWENFLHGAEHKTLNDVGKLSMAHLGNRLNTKLKKLTEKLQANQIEVLSAVEDRCLFSAKIFLMEFYEGNVEDIDIIENKENDERLKLMKPKDEVKITSYNDGNLVLVEDYYFQNYCKDIKFKIRNLLFPDHITSNESYRQNVTDEMVKIMYYACAHGVNYKTNDGKPAINWCSVFDFYDLKKMENMHDLQYFNKNGYYLEYNRTLGKKIVDDILEFICNPSDIKFKLFVGHTANILSVITALNLFRDDQEITAENIDGMNNRKWKTSSIVPSGSNILVLVYNIDSQEYVSIYLNEVPIEMVLNNNQLCIICPKNNVVALIEELLE